MRHSQCFTSLSLYCILYILWYAVVTSVVCQCIFLFLFRLCRIYNEKKKPKKTNHTPLFSVFLFSIFRGTVIFLKYILVSQMGLILL